MSWLAMVTSAVTSGTGGISLGHHNHQRLGAGNHAAHAVDGQLLDDACHRGGELGWVAAVAVVGLCQGFKVNEIEEISVIDV